MDGPHYPANVINNNSAATYPSSSAIAPHQLQHHQQHHQTLPPLQPGQSAMSSYGNYPHTPRTPATPGTPSSNNMGSYPPPPAQNAGRGAYSMMQSNPYSQPHPSYPTTSSMMTQATTAASHPQPIAPAPSPGGRVPPVLRPMPAGGVIPQQGMNSPYAQSPLMPQPSMLPEADQPTHVVGSQGRRGILPSAPGKPAAPAAGTVTGKSQIPQKDADGKFPCPHCTKTYLHAKHLKRHLLRHTGDRPYMCVLCRDTFSRSDILKRHFQKCSIRRGNPTGASHLSHPQAHVKKSAAAQQKAMGADGDVNHMNGMGGMPGDGMVHPFGLIPQPDGMSSIANDQSQLSRSNSMNRLEEANQDRRNMAGSVMGTSTRGSSFDQSYNGNVSNNLAANINPQLANYNMPSGQNGIANFGNQPSNHLDWSSMFQPGAQPDYVVNPFPPNVGQTQTAIKQEPNRAETVRTDGLQGDNPSNLDSSFFPTWGVPPSYPDPYQYLSSQILHFFFPNGFVMETPSTGMTQYLQPDNIRDFLEGYTHFHVHTPILHIPTFRIMDAHVGLLAAMCCIGACYSDRVSAANVREMMNYLKDALRANSRLYGSLSESKPAGDSKAGSVSIDKSTLEELQALLLTQILLMWNGSPEQREHARQQHPVLAAFAHSSGLLRIPSDGFSPLHLPNSSAQAPDPSTFDWISWVEQEQRIRIAHAIVVGDSAHGLYFNASPLFDSFEVHLPLPADDAAWDAEDAAQCAEALGLYGPEAALHCNPDGTQRWSQPESRLALKALLHSSYQIQPGTTNLYGKFILIHALLALLRQAQVTSSSGFALPSTPLPQMDWVTGRQTPVGSANNSGRATPVDGMVTPMVDGQTYKMFLTAFKKFKANWDADMARQFPPSMVARPRRLGFSRDGIHFYWLATWMLKNTRPVDLQLAPDQRLAQVIHILKSVRNWALTDGASRGEEIGSVADIDSGYGVHDMTLDMAQLFKPLPSVVETPGIPSVQTGIGNGP